MSLIKLSEIGDAPEEGTGKRIDLTHPYTEIAYRIALFKTASKFYAITDLCSICGGSLGRGILRQLFVSCTNEECLWNIKKGYCKFNHSRVMPTYKVTEQEDGLFIDI